MITFVTMWGKKVVIRLSADQDDFETAMATDAKNSTFHVGNKIYRTRSVAQWTPRTHRGPSTRRIRFTMF